MADEPVHDEPVYSPDQLKPGNRKWGRIGAIGGAVAILLYFWGNHEGNTENIFLLVTALILLGAVAVDAILRRNGLRHSDQ